MMRLKAWMFIAINCLSLAALAETEKPAPADKCPISFQHIDLRYNHAGGESKPQLELIFTNQSEQRVTGFTFSLSILDAGGYPNLYSDSLSYRAGLEPDKKRISLWSLKLAAVDIHHSGETAILQKVEFVDGSTWTDSGSQECKITVDFHSQ